MFVFLSIIIVLLSSAFLYFKEKFKYWEKRGVKCLKPSIPFGHFGSNVTGTKSAAILIDEHYKAFQNERFFGMYIFTQPNLVLKDLDLIKEITVKDFDYFRDRQFRSNNNVDEFWSKTLVATTGESWKKLRSTLTPTFTGNKMRYMFPLVNNIAENMISTFQKQGSFLKLEMKDTFSKLTNDTIVSTTLGVDCDSLNEPENLFLTIGKRGIDFTGIKRLKFPLYSAVPDLLRFLGVKIFVDEFTNFFRHVINDTIKLREENNLVRQDIIHLLLKARKGEGGEGEGEGEESGAQMKAYKEYLSNEYIAAQAAIFYFGGFDTTSDFLSFLTYNLATHLDVQEKLRNKIEVALENNNGDISYEVIQSIKYLDLVFNESMRLYSPITFLDRVCTKEYTIQPINSLEKPLVIEKGTVVMIPTYSLQRDGQVYENPDEFDPERLLSKKAQLFGFGVGPRACIGQRFAFLESKTLVCHLLKNFEIVTIEETQVPIQLTKKDFGVAPENGIWLGFKSRN